MKLVLTVVMAVVVVLVIVVRLACRAHYQTCGLDCGHEGEPGIVQYWLYTRGPDPETWIHREVKDRLSFAN
jgi:hypothetical protein